MALMNDIISKYQKEANQRIADARKVDPDKVKEKAELIDSIILSKGAGPDIKPEDPNAGKGSVFKTVSNTHIKEYTKNYNAGQTNLPIQAQKPAMQNTVIVSSGDQRKQEDVFKKITRLENENKKLKAEIEKLKKK